MGLLLLTLLLPQVPLHALSVNPQNEKNSRKTDGIFWMNTLCGMCRSPQKGEPPNGFKHLSLEAYSTNQSRQPEDFITSMSQHASPNNICAFSVSLTSYSPDHQDKMTSIHLQMTSARVRVIVLSVESLQVLFDPEFNWNSAETVLIFLIDDDANDDASNLELIHLMKNILRRVWNDFGVSNLFISILNNKSHRRLWTYDPFSRDDSTNEYGKALEIRLSNQSLCPRDAPTNFKGYPINVGLFHSPPAACISGSIEPDNVSLDDIHGLDGHTLKTFAAYRNFNVVIRGPSDGIEYGAAWDNGTITGTMGDVASRRIGISFNSQYIKKYAQTGRESDAVEFSENVDEDRVCIIVPASEEIPRWLRTFSYFHPTVWACFLMSLIVASLFWRIMQYHHDRTPPGYPAVLLDTFMLFAGSPVKLENIQAERMLTGSLLLLGMTAMGAFTGTLYHSFTNRMYYAPINSLEELDKSGLFVGTATGGLLDIFGPLEEDPHPEERPVLQRLKSKIKFITFNRTWPTIRRTAEWKNIASITRSSTFDLAKHRYVGDTHRSLLHLVDDCPQRYYLGYLLPKNSFLKTPLNRMILRLKESGMQEFWKKTTISNLLHQQWAERVAELEQLKPFSIYDMQSCFFILGVGLGVACCVLVGEVILYYFKRKRE